MRTLRFRGFTIVELLVVIAVIGILVSLLLPAIQKARANARSASCRSNLKQLAVALDHYHSQHRMFPAGGSQMGNGFSPLVGLLPHVEQEPLYNSINFNRRYSDSPNSTVAQSRIDVFVCPADTSHPSIEEQFAFANYMGNAGSGLRPNTALNQRDPADDPGNLQHEQDGIFWVGDLQPKGKAVYQRQQFITDGLSNTVAFSETVVGTGAPGPNPGGVFPSQKHLYMMRVADNTIPLTDAICESPGSAVEYYGERGSRWVFGNYGNSLYNHYLLPNDQQLPDCYSVLPAGTEPFPVEPYHNRAHMAARSWHPARTVNVVFVDARASSINPEIDPVVWRGIATRAGKEATPSEL